MNRILAGLRIVESSAFIAAPYAGLTLAQLGADVIRVDPPGGGLDFRRWPITDAGVSLYWAGLNKAKRSVCIDIRRPEGRELLAALITASGETGGIFLTNLPAPPPLDDGTLRSRRGDLIMASIYGNRDGTTAVDYTVNAATGFPLVTGPEGHDGPVNSVLPAWDLLAGVNIALAILAAERYRRQTGQGQLLRLALSDMALATAGNLGYIAEAQVNRSDRPRLGNSIYGTFGRDFSAADGTRVMVVAFTVKQWEALVAATGTANRIAALGTEMRCDLRKETDRYECRDAIASILAPWFRDRGFSEIRAILNAHGVCWGPYQSFRQLVDAGPGSPIFAATEQPGIGGHLIPGHPVDFGALQREAPRPSPRLGAHTDEVLSTVLGLDGGEIGRLHDRRVVCGADRP